MSRGTIPRCLSAERYILHFHRCRLCCQEYEPGPLPEYAATGARLPSPIYDAKPGKPAKRDFVGWTGIVPILYFIEYAIGLKPDAPKNRLTWTLATEKRCGCERFRFNGHVATLIAKPADGQPDAAEVTVESDGEFQLTVHRGGKKRDFNVKEGRNRFLLE